LAKDENSKSGMTAMECRFKEIRVCLVTRSNSSWSNDPPLTRNFS